MKKTNIYALLIACLCLMAMSAVAQQTGQQHWCGTDQHYAEQVAQDPSIAIKREQHHIKIEKMIQQMGQMQKTAGTGPPQKVIPVVVHVMHECDNSNISKAQIESAIAVLNEDFRRQNADTTATRAIFQPFAADYEIEFRLARKDENGNCTEGIVRVETPLTNNVGTGSAGSSLKALSRWPSDKYFNIWVVKSINSSSAPGNGTILGYAQFPGTGNWNTYGVVIRHDEFGRTGTASSSATNYSRTLTHEVGHCLDLMHTFQFGCGGTCSNTGDRVCDTPPAIAPTYGCNTNENTCFNDFSGTASAYSSDVNDQIENYMSYNSCQNMFTLGQKTRSYAALNSHSQLITLTSASNAIATGTNDGYAVVQCTPEPKFCASTQSICFGNGGVTFTDATYNDDIDPSWVWTWSFPGGIPATFSGQNPPPVIYNNTGVYDVSLTVTNAAGTKTITKTDFISAKGVATGVIMQGGEDTTFPAHPIEPNKNWSIEGPASVPTWKRDISAAESGTGSVSIRNDIITTRGTVRELISPVINLTSYTVPNLRFDYASSKRFTIDNPALKVYVSSDCGDSWILRKTITGAELETASPALTPYVPAASDWKSYQLNLIVYFTQTDFQVRIEMDNPTGSNTLYLDNIRVENMIPTGVGLSASAAALETSFAVVPNPATAQQATIKYDLTESSPVSIIITDITGRIHGNLQLQQSAGSYTLPLTQLTARHLAAGIYQVRLQTDNHQVVRKLSILK